MTSEERKQGLDLLEDETLASIVESEINEDGQLSDSGRLALDELSKRTPGQ